MASFQWIFDNAAAVAISDRAIVGQSITRNQTVRAVSRGNAVAKFIVTMPDGMSWSENATAIALLDTANKFTVEEVAFSNAGYTDWLHSGPLSPGQTWDVICVDMPTWTIFARNQVAWNGPFVFYESLV